MQIRCFLFFGHPSIVDTKYETHTIFNKKKIHFWCRSFLKTHPSIPPQTHTPHTQGGHSTLGYVPFATKKTLLFSLTFAERPPFLPTFTQWPPIFNKLLVTERPWHIFVTQRPLIFAFNSQTSDNFRQEIGFFENFNKFDKMLINFWPFWPWKPVFFWCISLKDHLFLCALSLKDPLFDAVCHPKTPTSKVLGGIHTSLSYVSAPGPHTQWPSSSNF